VSALHGLSMGAPAMAVLVLCCLVTGVHAAAEWRGNLAARLARLYRRRKLPGFFYLTTAVAFTAGFAIAGTLLHSPHLLAAGVGGYVSDWETVHGVIERKSRAAGQGSMPGTRGRWLLLFCAAGLVVIECLYLPTAGRLSRGFTMALATAGGALPFTLLPTLQRFLPEQSQ